MSLNQAASSSRLQALHQMLLEKKLDLRIKFPDVAYFVEQEDATFKFRHALEIQTEQEPQTVEEQVMSTVQQLQTKKNPNVVSVTQEERNSVFQKLQDIIESNQTDIPEDEQLYLEQQLIDITGFSISRELTGFTLPLLWGSVKALPHQKRYPHDQVSHHRSIHEAGMSTKRDVFGWMSVLPELQPSIINQEEFSIALPLLFAEQLSLPIEAALQSFRGKKVLVINPFFQKIAVAEISGVLKENTVKYQYGASPELVRSLEIWRAPAQGKVCLFFIENDTDNITLGLK